MDVLSDVLRAVRLTGAVYFDVNARAPWIAEIAAGRRASARKVMPEFEHVISFHIMLDGWCWAQLADESQPADPAGGRRRRDLRARRRAFHVDASPASARRPTWTCTTARTTAPLPFVFSELGGTGEKSRFVCGYLGCDARPFNPILDALPRMLHVKRSSAGGQLTHDLIRVALRRTKARAPAAKPSSRS